MNTLADIRSNVFHIEEKDGQIVRMHEVVILVTTPKYSMTNERTVQRERGIEEKRFIATDAQLEALGKAFVEMANLSKLDK